MKADIATYIELNDSGLNKNTPPSQRDIPDVTANIADTYKPNTYLIKLLRQLLQMADADCDAITPIDREALEDVIRYGSVAEVARRQHVTDMAIHQRVKKCLDALTHQLEIWQEPHEKIAELTRKVKELENSTNALLLKTQAQKIRQLKEENQRLHNMIMSQEENVIPSSEDYVPVDAQMKIKLSRTLEQVALQGCVIKKLKAHNITTVYDLVRLSESKLSRLEGITDSNLNVIVRHLKMMGLHLGTDVKYVASERDYYNKQ